MSKNHLIMKLLCALLMASLNGLASAVNAEVVVIGNPGTAVSALTADQAKAIYLDKTKTLPDGTAVKIVDLPNDSPVRAEFYSKVVKKNPSQIKAYWAKRIFTGKGTPPKSMPDSSSVKKWVAEAPGHLGYIDAGEVDDTVKVLLRIP